MIENIEVRGIVQRFVPGEAMIMIEHQAPLDIETYDFRRYLAEQHEDFAEIFDRNEPLITTFERPEKSEHSPYNYVTSILVTLPIDDVDDVGKFAEKTLDFIREFERNDTYRPEDNDEPIRLVSVSPNWFAIPSEILTGDGGPGDFPRPVPSTVNFRQAWKFEPKRTVPIGAQNAQSEARDKMMNAVKNKHPHSNQVEVFILDTLPSQEGMDNVMRFYPRNLAIQSLFGNGFPKMIESETLKRVPDTYRMGGKYGYKMPDHGVFIAGTIAKMEESAEITIVEVLNEWGVGTMYSILEGLRYVLEVRDENKTTIVNCSFTMEVPLSEEQLKTHDSRLHTIRAVDDFLREYAIPREEPNKHVCTLDADGNTQADGRYRPTPFIEAWLVKPLVEVMDIVIGDFAPLLEPEESAKLGVNLRGFISSVAERAEQTINRLAKNGSLIFAAAGNDGRLGNHPPACYPAAYDKVFGIAAYDDDSPTDLAAYSNLADDPITQGFSTFGGTIEALLTHEAKEYETFYQGMMGIYLSNDIAVGLDKTGDVVYEPNENGWAYWAGTSFATGVISGMVAALAATDDLKKVLKTLRAAKHTSQETGAHEVDIDHG